MGEEKLGKVSLEFRSISSLTSDERSLLRELTNASPTRSVFRQWLDHLFWVGYIYVAILKINGVISGWAAACLVADWNKGQVGVFINFDCRGLGFAREALCFLLVNIRKKCKNPPEYFEYKAGLSRLFREPVSQNGFKDIFLYNEEYIRARPVIKK